MGYRILCCLCLEQRKMVLDRFGLVNSSFVTSSHASSLCRIGGRWQIFQVQGLGQEATTPGNRSSAFLLSRIATLHPLEVINIGLVIVLELVGTGYQVGGLIGTEVQQSKRRNLFLWHRNHRKGAAFHESARQNSENEENTC
jgi:hypothetical protein